MDTLARFSTPLAILVAGALIAGAVFYVNKNGATGAGAESEALAGEIRGVGEGEHVLGNPEADIVVVEYSDAECPFCKVFHETMKRIMTEYGEGGKVAWAYRHLPLEQLHPKAPKQAEAMECAAALGGNDAFWKFTNLVYERTASNNSLDIGVHNTPKPTPKDPATGEPYYAERTPRSASDAGTLSDIAKEIGLDVAAFEKCLADGTHADKVKEDMDEALRVGGNNPQFGTPFSVIIVDGEQYPLFGAQSYETVKATIDSFI